MILNSFIYNTDCYILIQYPNDFPPHLRERGKLIVGDVGRDSIHA